MWKPADRIKYSSAGGEWPSAAQAAQAKLFATLQYQALQLEQRTWVPAMVPWRATEEGEVTPALIEWYERLRARAPRRAGG